jgi:hypothetical protein
MKVNTKGAKFNYDGFDMLENYCQKSYQAQAGDNFVNLQPGAAGSGMYILHTETALIKQLNSKNNKIIRSRSHATVPEPDSDSGIAFIFYRNENYSPGTDF